MIDLGTGKLDELKGIRQMALDALGKHVVIGAKPRGTNMTEHEDHDQEEDNYEGDEVTESCKRGAIRLMVRWLTRHYYPRLEIVGADRIPQTGPVLLCANHANSLIDPVIIGIAARRPVRFMAKAPLFDHPVLGPPMTALGMVPAFRGRDDARQVRRNLESLDVAAKVLIEGHAMGIFPEGLSTDQAHLEMVRSGAGRMALQAVEEGANGLLVVPIGIAYERKDQFRSSVLVRIAEPIDVGQLLSAQHDGDSRKARRAFTTVYWTARLQRGRRPSQRAGVGAVAR